MSEPPPLLFPIGLFVGTFPDGASGHHHEIRRGAKVQEISDPDLAGWAFAHGAPDAASGTDQWWDRATVERQLRERGIERATDIVDGLLTRGLLAEVPTEGPAAVAFARAHRVVPTLYGLGNSAEHPWRYSIGLLGQELVQVGWPVFEIWAWGDIDGDLWRACESFARQERDAGAADPTTGDPALVLAGFLRALHGLLNAQAAYLDSRMGSDA